MDDWLTRVEGDFAYREGWVYLQSAGAGLAFPGAADAAGQYYRDTALLGCDAQPRWREPLLGAKQRAARLMGVPEEEVEFFRNTSEVINLAANSLTWHQGDEVVVAADDYPCNVLPWSNAEAAGVRVVRVQPHEPSSREQQLIEAITPQTRVVSVSHVHPWTGTRLDLNRLGRACREVDALLVVDGIQALGAVPVDLSCVDVYGAGVFKWLMSGFGTAIGVFRERAREALTPIFRSYGNPAPSTSVNYAAPNFPGLYVLDATLEYLEQLGWANIFSRVDQLTGEILTALDSIGVESITPRGARAGIIALAEVGDSAALASELQKRRISASDKAGRILVSPHFYNTPEDIARFTEALSDILGPSRR